MKLEAGADTALRDGVEQDDDPLEAATGYHRIALDVVRALVIARIVVFREVDVVLPKKVIGNLARHRVQDYGKVFEREKLGGCRVEARREAANEAPLFSRQLAWWVEFESTRVFAAGIIEAAAQMVRDTALVMRLGRLGIALRFG
jgi:hypothetical protein